MSSKIELIYAPELDSDPPSIAFPNLIKLMSNYTRQYPFFLIGGTSNPNLRIIRYRKLKNTNWKRMIVIYHSILTEDVIYLKNKLINHFINDPKNENRQHDDGKVNQSNRGHEYIYILLRE